MVEKLIFYLVDRSINSDGTGLAPFSEILGTHRLWHEVPPMEQKVVKWSVDHPMILNVGIGAASSFRLTLTRLIFERIKDLYGPYDHIIRVRVPPITAASTSTDQQNWLAFEVLMEAAASLQETPLPDDDKLQELKQLAAEERYCSYGTISANRMYQAFGYDNTFLFKRSDPNPSFDREQFSPLVRKIKEELKGKRLLLLVENLHVPVPLHDLCFAMQRLPSLFNKQNRWLISTTTKDVCEFPDELWWMQRYHMNSKYYHAPPFDDLTDQEWAVLIREALRDASGSIHSAVHSLPVHDTCEPGRSLGMVLENQKHATLKQKQDEEFWLHIAQHCLYYGILYHPLQEAAGCQESHTFSITSDELVRCWVSEELLFSISRPTEVDPASRSNKHKSYFRLAYEAGKVVMKALQEYSLLPIYSVSTPTSGTTWTATTSAPSLHDAATGVSKVAEGVPRLNQDDITDDQKRNKLRWVSFMNNYGRHISWDWRVRISWKRTTVTTLILRGCSNISSFPLDKVLSIYLRVLDLSYTTICSLPPGFSQLLNLHLLSLRGCSQLQTLSPQPPASEEEPPPLAHLENLEVLDMNGVPLIELTQQDGSNKSNLHYLDLSGSKFITLPAEFFREMSSLEKLILCSCFNLKELPPSMAELSHLLVLHVEGTQITSFAEDMFEAMRSLHTLKLVNNMLLMSLPRSLSVAKALKELHIHSCNSLKPDFVCELASCLEDLYIQAWEALEAILINGHSNLRTFSLSGPWVRCLSLRGCSKLKIVNFSDDVTALEYVDLSGTSIEELPHSLPNAPHLRMLLLLNVPCFKRFPWHLLVRFPKVFYLDHSADDDNKLSKMLCQQTVCGGRNQSTEETTNTAQIIIKDASVFYSFNSDAANKLVMEGKFLHSFSVQVKQCKVSGMEPRNRTGKIHSWSPYADLNSSQLERIEPMMILQPKQRHVEISANNRHPDGLRHILSVTMSLFITDDACIRCLTELNFTMVCLEECLLIRCNKMEVVMKMHSTRLIPVTDVFPSLKIFQASNLNNLLTFIEPSDLFYSELITLMLLKHVHLEHCPRLEKLFPCSLSLPALETLVILFCSNLKTIFYQKPPGPRPSREGRLYPLTGYGVATSPLPNIKRIYLQELPQLQHFHDDIKFQFETPKWEKLFVLGCHSFHRLPLLKSEHPKSKVEVSGERDWWSRLQWRLPEQSQYFLHMPPPEFASRKKHIIRSYLR